MPSYKINWQKPTAKPATALPKARITAASIRLNKEASDILGSVGTVMIGFDNKKAVIGIKKHEGEDVVTYKMKATERPVGSTINCKAFLAQAIEEGILNLEKPIEFTVENSKDGCIYILIK